MDSTRNAVDRILGRLSEATSTSIEQRYQELGVRHLIAGLLGLWLIYGILLVFYRLCLSPIAKFPGPKLAAATEWYEFYYQLVEGGQWGHAVSTMHDKYGPIVRISPWELSIRDANYYNQLYVAASTRRTNMWPRGREGNGFQDSHHLSVSHDLHRRRRKPLESFFSRQGITRVEEIITSEACQLDSRLTALQGTGTVVHIDHAFTALTGDVIGHVACGMRPRLLEDERFSPEWHALMIKTVLVAPLFRCFGWMNSLFQLIPTSIVQKLYPTGISSMMLGKMGMQYIETIKTQIRNDKFDATNAKKSVFHHLLTSDIPESEKSTARLQAESMIFLIAGSVTSAHTLAMIVYHVLANPHIETRLREDLKEVTASYPAKNPMWADLEKIPYLQACIKESLRLNGLIGNLNRCSPDVELQYQQWTIPRNTPVGMSIYNMHTDPEVWSEPLEFKPERWLGKYDPQMDRNFVPFTRGSRGCLGINLAMTELYITTALVFRHGGPKLSLYETDKSDIEFTRDFVMGFPKKESRGVRVFVH